MAFKTPSLPPHCSDVRVGTLRPTISVTFSNRQSDFHAVNGKVRGEKGSSFWISFKLSFSFVHTYCMSVFVFIAKCNAMIAFWRDCLKACTVISNHHHAPSCRCVWQQAIHSSRRTNFFSSINQPWVSVRSLLLSVPNPELGACLCRVTRLDTKYETLLLLEGFHWNKLFLLV